MIVSSAKIFLSKRIVSLHLPLFISALCLCFLYFFSIVFLFNHSSCDDYHTHSKEFNPLIIDRFFKSDGAQTSLGISSGFSSACFVQAKHLRPDELRVGRYLCMNHEIKFIPFSQPFFCEIMHDEFTFNVDPQGLKVKIELEQGNVWAYVYCQNTGGDKLIERVMLKNQDVAGSSKLKSIANKIQKAKLFRQDCLFNKYGGSIFQMRKNRIRLFLDGSMLFLKPHDSLILKKDAFQSAACLENHIVLSVKAVHNGARFLLFSEDGHECIEIEKKFEPKLAFFNPIDLKEIQILGPQMFKCKIFDKWVTLESGDWIFIHKSKKILPLKNFDQIQTCINSILPGSLVIIDQIRKTNNNDFVIVGHFFDETRQCMGEIRQIVRGKG